MDDAKLAAIVDAIVRELKESGAVKQSPASSSDLAPTPISQTLSSSSVVPMNTRPSTFGSNFNIDLPDRKSVV